MTGTLKPSLLGKFIGLGVGGLVKLVTAFAWPSSVMCPLIHDRGGEFTTVHSTCQLAQGHRSQSYLVVTAQDPILPLGAASPMR